MRLNSSADGMYVISATPFTDTGALDLDSTARLMDFYKIGRASCRERV